jgi:hypothetical protein
MPSRLYACCEVGSSEPSLVLDLVLLPVRGRRTSDRVRAEIADQSTSVGCPFAKDLGCQDRNLGGWTADVVRRWRPIVRTSAYHLARPARVDMRSLHIWIMRRI